MNDLEKSVVAVVDAYARAVLAKNVDAFMQLYDLNVRVFDTWGTWSYDGAGAWRNMIEGWLGSLGDGRVRVTVDDLRVIASEEVSTASGFFTYAEISADGQEMHSLQNRLTWVLRRKGDGWSIVHEHTSAPIDFEKGTAILSRAKTV